MNKLIFILLLFVSFASFSQSKSFKITGTIIGQEDLMPLESATVYLERLKDSSLVTYTITDRNGKFVLEDKTYDDQLNLKVTHIGYNSFLKTLNINGSEIYLDSIALSFADALDEVIVKSRAPIIIKKDTLEFNVSSFKTKKDANVEDLLKELPGVEVEEDGTIKVNGKSVNKILVNGKPFFGNDPTITTRNLTKEIIDKVQITDTKSKSEAFSGETGDQENKTINLTIKEENNKGIFGRLAAGAGTDKLYEFAGLVNMFNNEQRVSVLGGGNNINSPGFSFGEIRKMFGGANSVSFNSNGSFTIDGRSFGGGEGITTSNNAGVNYADEIVKGLDISTNYFYSGSHSDNLTSTQRENILPDSRYFTNSESNSSNDTDSHRANLGFDVEIDSTFLINFNPSFGYSKSKNLFDRQESSRDASNTLTNASQTSSFVENIGKNFGNSFQMTKRFGNGGSFIRIGLNYNNNKTESSDFFNSEINIYGNNPEDIVRDQFRDGEQSRSNLGTNFTYRLPLVSKTWFLDLKYNLENEQRKNRRSTYDFDINAQDYSLFNALQSTDFENKNLLNNPNAQIVYRSKKMNFSFGTGYGLRTIKNKDRLRPTLDFEKNFDFLKLDANFSYRFSDKMSIYSDYDYDNTVPEISQLQPYQDVSDPLNTITGNPELKPSKTNRFYLGFNSYDFQKGTGFYIYANGQFTNDQVVSKTTVDEELVRNTTYTNINGAYSSYVGASYSKDFKIDTLQTLKARISIFTNLMKSVNFNNDVKYASHVNTYNPSLGLTYTWKNLFELRPFYRLSFSRNHYKGIDFETQNFLRHTVGIRTATFVPKKLEWRNDINYYYNPNVADGFQKSSWFWNATLAYSFLKDKASLTLKVYDLLNQNTNVQRIATQNYIQDSQSTVLRRYFMLSFSWKFNTLGPKGETQDNDFYIMD